MCVLVGWLVGAGLNNNYFTDVLETWMEDGSWPRMDRINFWFWSSQYFLLSLMLQNNMFFNTFDDFSENNA